MFRRKKQTILAKEEITNYISESDVYNSVLIDKISNPEERTSYHQITKPQEFRPDLISKDIYGSDSYTGILLLQLGDLGFGGLVEGLIIKVIPKSRVDRILDEI